MELAELLEGAERHLWSDERGSLEFVRVRDGVALLVLAGKLGDEAAAAWEQHFPWLLGRDKASPGWNGCTDGSEATGGAGGDARNKASPGWNGCTDGSEATGGAGGDARNKVALFMDGARLTLPNATLISTGSSLVTKARPQLDELHVLVSSGLLEMIAKTTNLALGGMMRITRDRAKFEAELHRVLARSPH
ncbi:MAG: hypothetical protein R6X02_28360 [Enhygromyxa sp.]